jgi:hypothetical protein
MTAEAMRRIAAALGEAAPPRCVHCDAEISAGTAIEWTGSGFAHLEPCP